MEESKRKVISEDEILATPCRKCHAIEGKGCLNEKRLPLTHTFESSELAFHRERIFDTYTHQLQGRFEDHLPASDRNMITYYAFIALCDSVSTKSLEILGRKMTSTEIQAFFVCKAVEILREDRMLG